MSILGVAILDTSLLSTIPLWFEKRINLASGLSFSGASVGSMIAPFFILFFSDLYGIRGAFIIIAAVWMQVFILGALQRPPPDFKVARSDKNSSRKVIWTTEKSGKSALSVTNNKQVELNIVSGGDNHCHTNGKHGPSYIGLLKRPQVLRVIIIITCGICGSRGKHYTQIFLPVIILNILWRARPTLP